MCLTKYITSKSIFWIEQTTIRAYIPNLACFFVSVWIFSGKFGKIDCVFVRLRGVLVRLLLGYFDLIGKWMEIVLNVGEKYQIIWFYEDNGACNGYLHFELHWKSANNWKRQFSSKLFSQRFHFQFIFHLWAPFLRMKWFMFRKCTFFLENRFSALKKKTCACAWHLENWSVIIHGIGYRLVLLLPFFDKFYQNSDSNRKPPRLVFNENFISLSQMCTKCVEVKVTLARMHPNIWNDTYLW